MKLFKLSLAIVAAAAGTMALAGPETLKGKPLPSFSLKTSDGKTLTSASLKGKVVVLDFWASWCGPCKAASPVMQSLYTKYAKKGLVIIGTNTADKMDKVAAYKNEHKYTYPFAEASAFSNKLKVEAIPLFIFVDRKGIVRRIDTGFSGASALEWETTVKGLLAK